MKLSVPRILGIAALSATVIGCATPAGQQEQIDQALRAAAEARAAADRAQVTAEQAKAMAEQANSASEANSKKVDRAFVKSQRK